MKCAQCAHDNPPGTKFCGECGARLEAVCSACHAKNPPANKFCGECGAPLTGTAPAPTPAAVTPVAATPVAVDAAGSRFASPQTYTPRHLADKILSSRAALEGERKQVTVMFTDVSGFTAMSSRLDPEEVHGIMDRAFEIILAAVHRYEGTINQFLGDGVMALFGAPIAHEDHPHRALSAALAIQRDLAPLRDDVKRTHGIEFRMRIGINTGLVVVGAIGRDLRMDYTAIGDTTNLASRMLNVAQPGQSVCTLPTYRATKGFFEFEDLGEFTVKGKTDPIRGWAVLRELRGRTRLEVSKERGLTPLLGRTGELEALRAAYTRAMDGHGAVFMLVGDPGVGKSRLLYEFLSGIDDGSHQQFEATCLSYGRGIPYHPLVALVRRYLGLPEVASDEDVRAAAHVRLGALGLGDEESTTLIAHFAGADAPAALLTRLGAQLKDRTHALVREMFLRASRRRALVLVVENIHWIDPSSEDFFGEFIGALIGHPVLLLLSCRPDVPVSWCREGVELRTIGGLDRGHATGMAQALLGADVIAPELLDVLLAKSEGNPLYVEEILRQLQETGGVDVVDGVARLSRTDVAVPETVHDIIAARVDRVEDSLKQTIQGAAVVGRQFPAPLVARVLDDGEPRVIEHLGRLHGLDFVYPLSLPVFAFKHALTQEVVYAGLLERRRRTYHAIVGAVLEAEHHERLDEVAEVLAHHYGRSAEHDKAVDYAILAGEKAQRRWANAEALAYFESALKRLETMPESEANGRRRIDAVLKQAEVKFALGRHAEQVQALEGIKEVVDTLGDPPRQAAWYSWAGFLHSLTGAKPQVSIAYCRQASKIADAGGFEHLRAFADCSLSHVSLTVGNLTGALETGERALALFEHLGNVWWACRALWALSPVANALGQWDRSLEYCRRALEHGTSLNDLRMKVVGWWRTGSTQVQRGDAAAGLKCCDEAQRLGPIPFDAAMIRTVRGSCLVKMGDVDAGLADLTEAVGWFERSGLRYTRCLVATWLVESRLRVGRLDGLAEILTEVLQTAVGDGYRHLEGIAERLLGECLLDRDAAAAEGHLTAALTIVRDVGARNEEGKALVAMAECSRRRGDLHGARALLETAGGIFDELGTWDEARRARALLDALPR